MHIYDDKIGYELLENVLLGSVEANTNEENPMHKLSILLTPFLFVGLGCTAGAQDRDPTPTTKTTEGKTAMIDTASPTTAPRADKPLTVKAREHTSAPFRTQIVFRLDASRERVWALLSDHSAIPSYFPAVTEVKVDNSNATVENGVGCVRSCSVNGMPLTEDILVFEVDRALGYAVRDGNPMGMTNHFGLILLEGDGRGGTLVTWKQYFDHPQADMLIGQIQPLMGTMVDNLIGRFGGERIDA